MRKCKRPAFLLTAWGGGDVPGPVGNQHLHKGPNHHAVGRRQQKTVLACVRRWPPVLAQIREGFCSEVYVPLEEVRRKLSGTEGSQRRQVGPILDVKGQAEWTTPVLCDLVKSLPTIILCNGLAQTQQ